MAEAKKKGTTRTGVGLTAETKVLVNKAIAKEMLATGVKLSADAIIKKALAKL